MTLKDLRRKCPLLPLLTMTNSTKSPMAGFLLLSRYVPDGGYNDEIYQEYGNYPGGYRRGRNRDRMLVPQNGGRDHGSGPGTDRRNCSRSCAGSSCAGSGDEFDNNYDDRIRAHSS